MHHLYDNAERTRSYRDKIRFFQHEERVLANRRFPGCKAMVSSSQNVTLRNINNIVSFINTYTKIFAKSDFTDVTAFQLPHSQRVWVKSPVVF